MPRPSHPVTALLKWPLLAVTLLGFLGLLTLQSFSLPNEVPRAAIARLLGVDIAPTQTTATPAGMAHSMQAHHHMAAHSMHAMQGLTHPPLEHHHHTNGESCPLCPLLSLPAVLVLGVVLIPPPVQRWLRRGSSASTPRGPPLSVLGLPPSRGPPA